MDKLTELEFLLYNLFPNIWRCANSYEWSVLRDSNLLSFKYLKKEVNYRRVKKIQGYGSRSLKPWSKELSVGDLIIIIGRNNYSGIAIAETKYDVKGPFLSWADYSTPAIEVKYLHKLHTSSDHLLETHNNPATFSHVYHYGFDLDKILLFLQEQHPEAVIALENYIDEKINKSPHEERLARITYNTNEWIRPSGRLGKSKNKDTHEGKYGYGHEEWLFDTNTLVGDYHYGFLEPINKTPGAFENNIYNIGLYTIDRTNSKRISIGKIKNAIAINSEEAENVKKYYLKRGWLGEMNSQIKQVEGDNSSFLKSKGQTIFNIKFKPEDLTIDINEVPEDHQIYRISRYAFTNVKDEKIDADIQETIRPFSVGSNFSFDDNNENSDDPGTKKGKYKRKPKEVEVIYLHEKISRILHDILCRDSNNINVVVENPTGIGRNKIDLVVERASECIFYEIKTFHSLKTCFREAIGQLFEYSYYPDRVNANKLIIVSYHKPNEVHVEYLKHLRKITGLKIYYQQINLKNKSLSEEI